MWNFGSLLGMCLILQILRGLLLAVSYNCDIGMAFRRVDCFIRESSGSGWLFRSIHSNGARVFFVFICLHMARGLYYSSFSLNHVWLIGCRILLVLPITISYMWNFGSLLGMCLILQILRKKNILDRDSQRPFECGFSTFINYRLRFRLHFFGRFSIYHFWCWTNYSVSLFF